MIALNVLKQSLGWLRGGAGVGADPRSATLPLPSLRPDGKLQTQALELPIVRHCNLSCRSCTHLSPLSRQHVSSPAQVQSDVSILARHFHTHRARIMGGEPLLHPELIEILSIVRRSGIADKLRIVTNGTLLPRQGKEFWRLVDEVEISFYPGSELREDLLESVRHQAQRYQVNLKIKHFDRFRESYAELGTKDAALVQRIYRTCNMAHAWSCHNVDNGYFYKCPESLMLPIMLDGLDAESMWRDGIKIEDTAVLAQRLLAYLQSDEPLQACRHCLGSVGRLFEHEQVARKQWRQRQQTTTEELLDETFLEVLESERPGAPWMCTRGDAQDPRNQALVERLGLDHAAPQHGG